MLGLDDIDEILGEIDQAAEMDIEQLEQEAEKIKTGEADIAGSEADVDEPDIASPDIDEADVDEELSDRGRNRLTRPDRSRQCFCAVSGYSRPASSSIPSMRFGLG